MTRQDGLGTLPYADYADPDPDALPFNEARPTVTVRTMNRGRSNQFDRAFLTCPNGHTTGSSSPVTSRLGARWLAGDFADEFCGYGGCGWES